MNQSELVEEIIDLGLKNGNLTYDEINDALPSEFFTLDELQEIMDILQDAGIPMVDYRRSGNRAHRRKSA